jgi:D-arginine dehydrogenase
MTASDVVIIGGGIAGVSLAARLAGKARVTLLEREDLLAMHTTGRSAALFSEVYGNEAVREWSREGRHFFENPPLGFSATPLVSPRPSLHVARPQHVVELETMQRENAQHMRVVTAQEAAARVRVLRTELFAAFGEEPGSLDIDVGALFEGFRRMAKADGAQIITGAQVVGLARRDYLWQVRTKDLEFSAPIVVNAAGAWAGTIGTLAGLGDRCVAPPF